MNYRQKWYILELLNPPQILYEYCIFSLAESWGYLYHKKERTA